MAAGPVVVPILTNTGTTVNVWHWSSNGLTTGNLQPIPVLGDINQNPIGVAGNPQLNSTPDTAAQTGTITVLDSGSTVAGANTFGQVIVTGAATAGSTAVCTVSGNSSVDIQMVLTGTTPSVTLVTEKSIDGGVTWREFGLSIYGSVQTLSSFTIPSAQTVVARSNVAATTKIRLRCTATSGSPSLAVTFQPGYGIEDVSLPGAVYASTNARRNGGVLHRNAITSVDKLATVGTVTLSGGTGGSLVSATTYYVSASAYNRWGNATPANVVSATPGGSNTAMNAAFAQVTNADGYDIFLSTDSGAPKWVGRITEAQRASGIVITAVGTTGAGGTAGGVLINVPGTGLQTTAAPYTSNNAYTPAVVAGVGSVSCVGYATATVHYKVAVTDLRSLPTFSPALFFQDQVSSADWFLDTIQSQPLSILTADEQPLEQSVTYQVNGATAMVVCISQLTGQGAALSAWVELA